MIWPWPPFGATNQPTGGGPVDFSWPPPQPPNQLGGWETRPSIKRHNSDRGAGNPTEGQAIRPSGRQSDRRASNLIVGPAIRPRGRQSDRGAGNCDRGAGNPTARPAIRPRGQQSDRGAGNPTAGLAIRPHAAAGNPTGPCGWQWQSDRRASNLIVGPAIRPQADFGVILEPVYTSFLNSGRSKLHLFSGLIPEGFFIDFCVEISSFGHPKSRFSHGRYCKNQLFTKLVFCNFRTRILVLFGSLGNQFSSFPVPSKHIQKQVDFQLCPMCCLWLRAPLGER